MDDLRDLLYLVNYGIFVGAGLTAILGSLTGGNWYFEREHVKPHVERFGKPGAQLFHLLVGLLVTGCGCYLIWHWFKG